METTAIPILHEFDWYYPSMFYVLHCIAAMLIRDSKQDQVDGAPTFPQVMKTFKKFLEKNGLIEPETGRRLVRFAWCTDGPWDVRDFVIKQCFISKVSPFSRI